MNKKQLIDQLWGNDAHQAHAIELGYETTGRLAALKVVALHALIAEADALIAEADGDAMGDATHNVVPPKYRATYVKGKSASGKSTLSCGDTVAGHLAGMAAEQVCRIADAAFGQPFGHHSAKYAHLNVGMQRMNAGNRVRGLIARKQGA